MRKLSFLLPLLAQVVCFSASMRSVSNFEMMIGARSTAAGAALVALLLASSSAFAHVLLRYPPTGIPLGTLLYLQPTKRYRPHLSTTTFAHPLHP